MGGAHSSNLTQEEMEEMLLCSHCTRTAFRLSAIARAAQRRPVPGSEVDRAPDSGPPPDDCLGADLGHGQIQGSEIGRVLVYWSACKLGERSSAREHSQSRTQGARDWLASARPSRPVPPEAGPAPSLPQDNRQGERAGIRGTVFFATRAPLDGPGLHWSDPF
ncbi:hypothetical protein T492DRAFT_1135733 [Pavlovales sp. CCMP2436]|nr:hypothetical protein T492DRAFT_1135733 [Pavlovales sp. CCMP2436]